MDAKDLNSKLANLLSEHYDQNELVTLCFDLGVDHEEIAGQNSPKPLLVRQLIAFLIRRGRLQDLIYLLEQTRPLVEWSQLIDDSVIDFNTPLSITANERNLKIFLCHASEDKPIVRDLYARLISDGYKPWFDEEDLIAGQDWEHEIATALRNSDVVLICASQKSVAKRGFVQKELREAIELAQMQPVGAIFLIPVKLNECNLPDFLSRYQWVEYSSGSGYHNLTRALHAKAASLGIRPNPSFNYGNARQGLDNSFENQISGVQYLNPDRNTYSRIHELLPSSQMVYLLRDFDFGNTFFKEDIVPLYRFYDECQLPEFGFLDEELESYRLKLADNVIKLVRAIGRNTFPLSDKPGVDINGVPKDWHYKDRQRWDMAVNELNKLASETYGAYVELIKTARKKLTV